MVLYELRLKAIQRLLLSLLEVSTAAHGFCSLLTYFVWWLKPTNVATPTIMRGKEAWEVYALLKCSGVEYNEALEMAQKGAAGDSSQLTGAEKIVLAANALQHLLLNPQEPPRHSHRFLLHSQKLIPGAPSRSSTRNRAYEFIAMAVSPALYGVIHFLAWNDHFPTPLERVLWHVSLVVVTCLGIMWFVGMCFVGMARIMWIPRLAGVAGIAGFAGMTGMTSLALSVASVIPHDFSRPLQAIFKGLIIFIFFLTPMAHIVSSSFLIVESLRQLFFLEPAAYQLPSWTNYWPHLSRMRCPFIERTLS